MSDGEVLRRLPIVALGRPRLGLLQPPPMERPTRFEHHRYLGDKRTQVCYDVDALADEDAPIIAELLEAETFACFAPDTLAEAQNRGYRLYRRQRSS